MILSLIVKLSEGLGHLAGGKGRLKALVSLMEEAERGGRCAVDTLEGKW
jgi:hypothetical protein